MCKGSWESIRFYKMNAMVVRKKKAIKSSKNKNKFKKYLVRAVLIHAYPPGIGSYVTILAFIIITFVVL